MDITISKDNIMKATYIIAKKELSSDNDIQWAIEVLKEAFLNGYEVIKTS